MGREGQWSGKGPPVAMGGMGGGPSKRQLGPDPHLGALDPLTFDPPPRLAAILRT